MSLLHPNIEKWLNPVILCVTYWATLFSLLYHRKLILGFIIPFVFSYTPSVPCDAWCVNFVPVRSKAWIYTEQLARKSKEHNCHGVQDEDKSVQSSCLKRETEMNTQQERHQDRSLDSIMQDHLFKGVQQKLNHDGVSDERYCVNNRYV